MFSLWNTQDVTVAAIRRDQEISSCRDEGKTEKQAVEKFKSAGVKEPCIWPFMSVTRHVLHVLHVLLGLGNKVMNQFWTFTQERIEKLHEDVVQVQNVTIVSCLGLEKAIQELETKSQELEVIFTARKEFNKNNKRKLNED